MRDSRVYVVQNQHALDRESGQLRPKFDFKDALEYLPGARTVEQARREGRLLELLHPSDSPWKADVVQRLRAGLKDYQVCDHLLLVGNPILMSMASTIAFEYSTLVRFLQWSSNAHS